MMLLWSNDIKMVNRIIRRAHATRHHYMPLHFVTMAYKAQYTRGSTVYSREDELGLKWLRRTALLLSCGIYRKRPLRRIYDNTNKFQRSQRESLDRWSEISLCNVMLQCARHSASWSSQKAEKLCQHPYHEYHVTRTYKNLKICFCVLWPLVPLLNENTHATTTASTTTTCTTTMSFFTWSKGASKKVEP